jgi:hypothetical protein
MFHLEARRSWEKAIGAEKALKSTKAIQVQEEKEIAENEVTAGERICSGPSPESRERPKHRLKTIIIGIGLALIIIGIALAIYAVVYEDESFLIALAPGFLGVIVIIAALFGKKLWEKAIGTEWQALKPHEAIRPTEGLAMNKFLFITGLVICGIAAGLLLMGKIESGVAALVGSVGIALIGSSAAISAPNKSLKEKKRLWASEKAIGADYQGKNHSHWTVSQGWGRWRSENEEDGMSDGGCYALRRG